MRLTDRRIIVDDATEKRAEVPALFLKSTTALVLLVAVAVMIAITVIFVIRWLPGDGIQEQLPVAMAEVNMLSSVPARSSPLRLRFSLCPSCLQ